MVNIRNKEICDKAAAVAAEYAKDYNVVICRWGCTVEGVLSWLTYSEDADDVKREHQSLIGKRASFFWSNTPFVGGFSILLKDPFGEEHIVRLDENFEPKFL